MRILHNSIYSDIKADIPNESPINHDHVSGVTLIHHTQNHYHSVQA